MTDTVNVPRFQMEDWRNDLSHHGVGDIAAAVEMDNLLAAAPKAEPVSDPYKLAREAISNLIEWDKQTGFRVPYRVRDPLISALSLIQPLSNPQQLPEAPKVEQEPVANPLVFGLGALVVDHGKYGGEPAVFVAKAKATGRVGELTGRDYFDRESLQPGELVLQFPTDTQAKSVADALVGSPAPASDELLEALGEAREYVSDHQEVQPNDETYGLLDRIDRALANHKGPQS